MNLREQFGMQTGLPSKFKMQRYGGDSNGPEIWNDEYVEWLEQRNKEQLETIEFVLDKVDWDNQKFSVRVVCRVGLEKQLKKSGVL